MLEALMILGILAVLVILSARVIFPNEPEMKSDVYDIHGTNEAEEYLESVSGPR